MGWDALNNKQRLVLVVLYRAAGKPVCFADDAESRSRLMSARALWRRGYADPGRRYGEWYLLPRGKRLVDDNFDKIQRWVNEHDAIVTDASTILRGN